METIKRKLCCVPNEDIAIPRVADITQLEADLKELLDKHKDGDSEKVPMSEEVQNYAFYIENKVMSGAQISKGVLNTLGTMHWAAVGLTIIAMGLDMTLKMHDNKEQCIAMMKDSLDIWKIIMKPELGKKGSVVSDYMEQSMHIIFGGYLCCQNILNSRKWKRFICASDHEKELGDWMKKKDSFLLRVNAVMIADTRGQLLGTSTSKIQTCATTLVALEQRKRDVMQLLKPEDKEDIRIVVLHGMGGVGKSTLGDAVYKEFSLSGERRCCGIMMDENPSKDHIQDLQKQMVKGLRNRSLLDETNTMVIKDQLRQVLLSETEDPVFIYIDNVLQHEYLEKLLPLDCDLIKLPKGSRWLVTTRDQAVCTRIFDRNKDFKVEKFNVEVLNDSDARKLFFLHAFGQEEPSSEVLKSYDDDQGLIRDMVSSICGNLPLALRLLGRSLFKKSKHEWKRKYDELKSETNVDLYKQVSNVLQSSYNALDDEQTQTAFLMICVCFYNCPCTTAYDVVESILPRANTFRLTEMSLVERQFSLPRTSDNLGVRNVFTKMHDLVRNFGYQRAVEMKCAPTKMITCKEDLLGDDKSWSSIKWLRVPPLEDGIEAEFLEKCKDVEMIVLDSTRVNGKIRNPPQQLKVIITSSSLPLELDKLKEVAFLQVGDIDIKELPVAPSLQVLRGFSAASIPKEAIDFHKSKLRKLWCGRIGELSSYFCQQMTNLQVLTITSFEGQSLPVEMGSLPNLEALRIESTTIQELPRSLVHLRRLQFLGLVLDNVKEIPSGVLGELKELVHLQLLLERVHTPVPMQDFDQLASLQLLSLHLPGINRLITNDDGVSLKLEKLKDFDLCCPSLSSLEGVQLSCPSLECLSLTLGKLKVLPSRFITGSTNLKALLLTECESLEELSSKTEMLWALESLLVSRCRSLKTIFPEGLMKSLKSLALIHCPALRKLPSDVDEQKAGSMQFLACDTHLLPPQFLPLPRVLAFSNTDLRAVQQVDSYMLSDSFYPVSSFDANNSCLF